MGRTTEFKKIRRLTTNNSTGNSYGITIPSEIYEINKETNFKILNGGSEAIKIESTIISEINTEFKKMSVELPSEFYSQIKNHQMQIREIVRQSVNPLSKNIILASGCKN